MAEIEKPESEKTIEDRIAERGIAVDRRKLRRYKELYARDEAGENLTMNEHREQSRLYCELTGTEPPDFSVFNIEAMTSDGEVYRSSGKGGKKRRG